MEEAGRDTTAGTRGAYSSNFTTDFDRHFRQAFARSVEQAREFIDFVQPVAGSSVIEVGAGSGRITFDGGLAERIGPGGRLLVTDPSEAQIAVATRRAAQLGMEWIRFECAPVESLPESGAADLCVGAAFLHFVEPGPAIAAMARAVRPGGRVAVNAIGEIAWPPFWQEILEPAHRALAARGLSATGFTSQVALERHFHEAGLTVDRAVAAEEWVNHQTADIAIAMWRQTRFVGLMLRRLPEDTVRAVEAEVEARLRRLWAEAAPNEVAHPVLTVNVVGHR